MGYESTCTRAFERKHISMLPVRVEDENQPNFGFIRDISCRGISMFGLKPLAVGRKYDIEFTLPDMRSPIKCRATVKWNSPHTQSIVSVARQGLMFEDIDPEVVDKLDNWVKGDPVRVAA